MIHHLAENGTMALVLPHGALFRGGAEQHIRKFLIESKNYLDAVIGLPGNIFYGTGIPTCILVFKKCRENPDDVIFIDASNDYEKVKTQNVLKEEHIEKIIDTYRIRTEIEKYSKKVLLSEIAENDYNLNIPRYVDTFEAEDDIDIEVIANEIKAIDEGMKVTDQSLVKYCKELGMFQLLLIWKSNVKLQKYASQNLKMMEEKRFGEIAKFSKGKGISKSEIDINGTIECIRYGELYTIYGETISDVTSRTNSQPKDLVFSKRNDVIIPASGETQIGIATASCVLKEGIVL